MASAKDKDKSKGSKAGSKKSKYTADLPALIAAADELRKGAAKLVKELRACKAAGGRNAFGGDTTTSKGTR